MAEARLGKRKRQPEPDRSLNHQSTPDSPLFLTGCNAAGMFTNAPATPSSCLARNTDSRDVLLSSPPPPLDRPFRDRQPGWQEVEEKALVEFILLYGNGDSWPATKDVKYWDSAAKFIQERSGLQLRTANACRSRTSGSMRQRYKSPKIAEEQMANSTSTTPVTVSDSTEYDLQHRAREVLQDDVLNMENMPVPIQVLPNIACVTSDLEVRLMSQLFSSYANRYFDVSVPVDFIPLALSGMKKLKDSNKPNVIYDFTKAMSLL